MDFALGALRAANYIEVPPVSGTQEPRSSLKGLRPGGMWDQGTKREQGGGVQVLSVYPLCK